MIPPARPQAVFEDAPPTPSSSIPGLIAPQAFGRSTALIGQVVVRLGYATTEAVERAVERARETGRLTGRVLIEEGVLTPQQLARVLHRARGRLRKLLESEGVKKGDLFSVLLIA